MSIFGRYLFRQAAGASLLILLSLSGVVWIALALRQLNLITSEGQDVLTFLKMTTLALPNMMALIAPVALLIACLHTLNRLNADSELIVMTASGASFWTVARPLLLLALVVSVAVSSVNHWAMPWSLRLLRDYVIQVRTDLISQVLQPGRFTSPERNLTFHIRDRAFNGELIGVLMHDARDRKQTISYLAERGAIQKQAGSSFLLMSKGHMVRRTDPGEPAQIIAFDSYGLDLDRFEQKGEQAELKPRERFFDELAFPNPDDADFKRQPGQFRAELHERFASPLYPFAFVLIALAAVGQAKSTRHGRIEALAMAFVVAAMVRLAGLAANNLVVLNASAVPLLYATPGVAGIIALLAIRRAARPRAGPSFRDNLLAMFDWFAARLPRGGHRRTRERAEPAA